MQAAPASHIPGMRRFSVVFCQPHPIHDKCIVVCHCDCGILLTYESSMSPLFSMRTRRGTMATERDKKAWIQTSTWCLVHTDQWCNRMLLVLLNVLPRGLPISAGKTTGCSTANRLCHRSRRYTPLSHPCIGARHHSSRLRCTDLKSRLQHKRR